MGGGVVFAKTSLIKIIFEEGKKFDSRTFLVEHFLHHSSILDVFWPRRGLQANYGTV